MRPDPPVLTATTHCSTPTATSDWTVIYSLLRWPDQQLTAFRRQRLQRDRQAVRVRTQRHRSSCAHARQRYVDYVGMLLRCVSFSWQCWLSLELHLISIWDEVKVFKDQLAALEVSYNDTKSQRLRGFEAGYFIQLKTFERKLVESLSFTEYSKIKCLMSIFGGARSPSISLIVSGVDDLLWYSGALKNSPVKKVNFYAK